MLLIGVAERFFLSGQTRHRAGASVACLSCLNIAAETLLSQYLGPKLLWLRFTIALACCVLLGMMRLKQGAG